ncbi:hypothetical protein [Actinocrispum wychmicini]|uniref:Uncharacterized protein n=1 Tax=Actinocrispum wychmicini TaxID=1213861 RepID=A0A4R2JWN3_9PSEU|nr:hypothetical protein [Actinocrispum wychmicini]TCO58565.1 hypothetical protein EV192_105636 [Actinocrispum wychmicini]
MGKKHKKKDRRDETPAERVRRLMKAGKVKKKCCRSSSRCGKCPVLALRKAKAKLAA